jgi:GTPase SAR1 family protein
MRSLAAILYHISGESTNTTPTVGFNVETVKIGKLTLNIWVRNKIHTYNIFLCSREKTTSLIRQDVGGQDRLRPYWIHYYTGTRGIVYVVDSSDRARIPKAREEFAKVLGDEQLAEASILLIANKQDMPGALSKDEMKRAFEIEKLAGERHWEVFPTVAKDGTGLVDSFRWLADSMEK